jgi:hypothetical protein
MDSSLHNMRIQARRFGVVVVFMFLWSTLLALVPPPAQAAMPMHDHTVAQHMMNHSAAHPSPQQQANHHGEGACCFAGQHCTSSCLLPLLASDGFPAAIVANEAPLSPLAAQPLTRPSQPPRRPPKA